jgi:thioredoxin reductase
MEQRTVSADERSASKFVDVAIVGAGPYGLSIAAHLRALQMNICVFGHAMQTWQDSMPAEMRLKSEPFASSISDPAGAFSLAEFCRAEKIPYADVNLPVSREVFVAYGKAFQKRFVPDLDPRMVVHVSKAPRGFHLHVEGGGVIAARRVIVAAGIGYFGYVPPELRDLPKALVSHSAAYGDASHLAGRDVLVVGAGSSAVDVAALLRSSGAQVRILSRRSEIRFQTPLGVRSLSEKVRAPMTGIGPGWKSVLCVKAPLLFHAMPEQFRVDVVRRYLGPAPGWFVRDQVDGHVPYILESQIVGSRSVDGRVELTLRKADGSVQRVSTEHVVAATGYRVDLQRLRFLDAEIRTSLRRAGDAPALSRNFESSIAGLYFVGTAAANSFGPMLRFVYGTAYASRRVAGHILAASRGWKPLPDGRSQEVVAAEVAI